MTFHPKAILLAFLTFLLILVALFSPATANAQDTIPGDKLIFGGSFILQRGQELEGDLVVFGGTVEVSKNATVQGDVAVIGGTASIDGTVLGDVVTLGGVISLHANAVVYGDATAVGGVIERDPGAQVYGNIVETQEPQRGFGRIGPGGIEITPSPGQRFWNFPFQNAATPPGPISWIGEAILRGMGAIAWTAILAALGVFLILLAPKPTERIALGIKHNPLLAFAVGFGASLIAGIVAVVLGITICLLPLSLAIGLGWLATLLFGWLALGWLLGRELMRALNSAQATPIWEMIVGVALLTLLWKLPTVFPFVGGLASFLVMFVAGNIAIGGVVLTRFGTQAYPFPTKPSNRPPTPPTESALPEHSQIPPDASTTSPPEPLIPPPPPSPDE